MDWLKELIEKHTVDGKTEIDAVMNAFKEEFPKHAVPKDVYNEQAEKLKVANSTLDALKKSNKDAEELQQKITDYEAKVQQLETERSEERKTYALKEALTKEGVSDVEYMMFKLGKLEVDKDGNIVDLDNKVKALKETNPTFFASEAENNEPVAPGYQVVDSKLESGRNTEPEPQSLAEAIALEFKK